MRVFNTVGEDKAEEKEEGDERLFSERDSDKKYGFR